MAIAGTIKKAFFIKNLDSGYILTIDEKKYAIPNYASLETILIERFKIMLDRVTHAAVNNIAINIQIDENLPQLKNE